MDSRLRGNDGKGGGGNDGKRGAGMTEQRRRDDRGWPRRNVGGRDERPA